jgi:Ca2+-transporting ATPase
MAENWDVTQLKGLTEQEALERLRTEGYNELPAAKKSGFIGSLIGVLREPMFLLLIACGVIYLVLGETTDAIMLLGFVFVIIGITFYQERKTERALEALRDLSSPRALVVRDGVEKRIVGREVARGDLLVLAEGDRVPADATLLQSSYMTVDESLLTGESVPVRKTAAAETAEMGRPGGDGLPFLFSGTLVVKGRGMARVLATGAHTEMGKIGKALQSIEVEATPLSRQTGRLVRNFAITGFFLCLIVVVVYGLTRNNWMGGVLSGITLAMAMIPEEFPVVLSIFMALGAWRIAQKHVLTRRVPAIETLGAAEVLCVDKTGTLTQNRMTVTKLVAGGETYDTVRDAAVPLPEAFHELMEFSILASHVNPYDPMEKAFRLFGDEQLRDTEHLHQDWDLEREFALSEHLLAMSNVWRSTETKKHVIAAKGAPEAIADLCHFSPARREELAAQVDLLAREGLRVLGVAKSHLDKQSIPEDQHDFDFEFLGLVGLSDPIRPTVPAAIRECYTAGIRVVMITGDYPATAQNIARQIGLTPSDAFVTGPELDTLSDAELAERAKTVNIFARVVPEQKLRILMAVKSTGTIAAMTGDGVNDAPALKAADIGIAMGGTGTDVAREAAALVLLDDDFSSIVHAVRLGRRIFDNLKNAIAFILAVHVPIAGLTLIPVLLGEKWPLVLMPVHVVFLEMIIDPACSVVFEVEPEEPGTMNRPPRDRNEPLLSRRRLLLSLAQGLGVLAAVLAVFVISLQRGADENTARALTFATLIVANIGLIMVNRSWHRSLLKTLRTYNSAVWWVVGGALLFLGLVIYTPGLQDVFHFAPLPAIDLVIALVAGVASILWFEFMKLLGRAF